MRNSLAEMRGCLSPSGSIVLVLGKSQWNGTTLPTVELFEELAGDCLEVQEKFWYPTKNRYMSYARHNGADINREYVVVLRSKR